MKEPSIGLSAGLRAVIDAWLKANCSFPTSFLEELKKELEAHGYRKAAGSLTPANPRLVVKYDELCNIKFFCVWELHSDGPPKARTFIYSYARRRRRGLPDLGTYVQGVNVPLPEMVELLRFEENPCLDRSGNAGASWSRGIDHYFCLPEEIGSIKAKVRGHIAMHARVTRRNAMEAFAKARHIPAKP